MRFVIHKFQGAGLLVMFAVGVAVIYFVSLQVAATRSELRAVTEQIDAIRLSNRMIEGDIAVVANVRQLDQWNREMIGYAAPMPGQYLSGERAIASIDRLKPIDRPAAAPQVLLASADDGANASATAGNGTARRSNAERLAVAEIAAANLSAVPVGALR